MKKFVLLILVLLPFAGIAQRFNGGVLAGGLVSQVDGDNQAGYYKFGYLGGAFVSLKLSRRSSLQLEMEYIQKGSRLNADSNTNTGTTYVTRLHYLEIPVLYQLSFGKRFQAEFGAAADVLLGSYVAVNGLESNGYVPYRSFTASGIAGFSCFITDHLKAGLRVNYSLMSVRDGYVYGQRQIFFEAGQYNNVLSVGLSWYFLEREY